MNNLDAAVFSRLAGGTALISLLGGTAIYSLQAPDSAPSKFVEFGWQGGGNETITPHEMLNGLERIKAVVQEPESGTIGGKALANQIEDQIYGLMQMKPLTVSGWGSNFWLDREEYFEYVEVDEAKVKWWHAGGLYRVRLSN